MMCRFWCIALLLACASCGPLNEGWRDPCPRYEPTGHFFLFDNSRPKCAVEIEQ